MGEHDKDKGVVDSVKDALGMGDDDRSRQEGERHDTTHGREAGTTGQGTTGTRPGDQGLAGESRSGTAAGGTGTGGTAAGGTGGTSAGRGGIDDPHGSTTEPTSGDLTGNEPADRDRI